MTLDVDLLGLELNEVTELTRAVKEICSVEVENDGITFLNETLQGKRIREDQIFGGVRVTVRTQIGTARGRLQIDFGFGDVVTPSVTRASFPTLLDSTPPILLTYPRETVIPDETPIGLPPLFAADTSKQTQWNAFLRRTRLTSTRSLSDVIDDLSAFLLPPLEAVRNDSPF